MRSSLICNQHQRWLSRSVFRCLVFHFELCFYFLCCFSFFVFSLFLCLPVSSVILSTFPSASAYLSCHAHPHLFPVVISLRCLHSAHQSSLLFRLALCFIPVPVLTSAFLYFVSLLLLSFFAFLAPSNCDTNFATGKITKLSFLVKL